MIVVSNDYGHVVVSTEVVSNDKKAQLQHFENFDSDTNSLIQHE